MKLKYNFVVRSVAGQAVALAVGDDNKNFNGMIKLNSVAEFIFNALKSETTVDEIVTKITESYDVSAEEAKSAVDNFIDTLRKNDLITE